MKEGRIFEYMLEHTNTAVFRNLFEVLGLVLHELRMTHIKPSKPVNNDVESGSEEDEEEITDVVDEDITNSDTEVDSDTESNVKSLTKKISKSKLSKTKSDKIKSKPKVVTPNTKVDQGGIKILEINDYKTIIVHVRLNADAFYSFDSKYDSYTIGLEPQTMFNFIKNIDKDGIMTVFVAESNKQVMNIELKNLEKKKRSVYEFKLMDLNENKYEIPSPQFDIIVEMKTDEFHNICKEMVNHGKYMAIECTEKKIEFKCKGNSGVIRQEFENGAGVIITINNDGKKNVEPKIIREVYDLNNIVMFTKCRNLCNTIQILLKNNNAMFIRYEIATLGAMQVGFVPVNEDNLNKNMNYDESFDKYYTEPNLKLK
jgi:proliferating cell nuclear antigen PCNA